MTDFFFLKVPDVGKSKIKVLTNVVSDEGLRPGLQTATFLVYPHVAESDHVFCVSSFFNF